MQQNSMPTMSLSGMMLQLPDTSRASSMSFSQGRYFLSSNCSPNVPCVGGMAPLVAGLGGAVALQRWSPPGSSTGHWGVLSKRIKADPLLVPTKGTTKPWTWPGLSTSWFEMWPLTPTCTPSTMWHHLAWSPQQRPHWQGLHNLRLWTSKSVS